MNRPTGVPPGLNDGDAADVEPRQVAGGAAYPDYSRLARVRGDKRSIDYTRGMLQPLVIDLTNAQTLKEIQFSGDVIYLDRRSTGTIRFKLDTAQAAAFPLFSNDAVKPGPYKSLLIEWDAQAGKFAYLWCGYGIEIIPALGTLTTLDSITNRVDVDNWHSFTTTANKGFIRYYQLAAVAAHYSYIQLKNPVGSGKTAYLDRVDFYGGGGVPDQVLFGKYNTDLANDAGAWYSKYMDGVAGVSHVRYANDAGGVGPDGSMIAHALTAAVADKNIIFDSPYRLDAGKGFLIRPASVNTAMTVVFSGREE